MNQYRSHTCGALRASDADKIVSFAITEKYYDITNIDDAIFRTTGKYYLQPKKVKEKDENS